MGIGEVREREEDILQHPNNKRSVYQETRKSEKLEILIKSEIERSRTYHSSGGSTLKTAPFGRFLAALKSHSLGINI